MTDDKRKRGKPDRRLAAGLEVHEVRYLAKKFKVSMSRVRQVIKRVGNRRVDVEAALR